MLKYFLKFCFVFLALSLQINAYKQPVVTADYLIGNNWGSEYQVGTGLVFKDDNTFEAFVNYGMDFQKVDGKYEITEDKVTLYEGDTDKTFLTNGTLIFDPDSAKFQYYLYFDDGTKVYNKNTMVKEGTNIILHKEFKAVTMGIKKAETISNVKFRIIPDTDGEIIEIYVLKDTPDGMPDEQKLSYVPAKTSINVLARTEKKVKVKDWNNYWYYVEVPDAYGFNYTKGWMFGEFVLIK